jgi:hypothetical protein
MLSSGWFTGVWITQKKAYNIQNTTQVWNQGKDQLYEKLCCARNMSNVILRNWTSWCNEDTPSARKTSVNHILIFLVFYLPGDRFSNLNRNMSH